MDYQEILSLPKTIAVVGLSDNPTKPSYQIAKYLIDSGFTIIPVNPTITQVFGLKSYPSLFSIPKKIKIDIVDVFRKSEDTVAVVKDLINSPRRPLVWLQAGIISEAAKNLAESNGIKVVMDLCIMKAHQRLSETIK